MKVMEWLSWEEASSRNLEQSIGGMGGFFNFDKQGMRWPDYLEQVAHSDEDKGRLEAIRTAVLGLRLRYNGVEHQNERDGVPVFDDGTVGLFSYRAWGDLMAAIWSTEEDVDCNYMAFYC